MDKIMRQSALPEGAEKELRKIETNRSNLKRELTSSSRKQAEKNIGLDGSDEKDFTCNHESNSDEVLKEGVPPVPSAHHTHALEDHDVPSDHMPEGLEIDAENGGTDPEKV